MSAAASIPKRDSGRAGLRVLVVDDNRDAAESLAALFTSSGHEALATFDGPGALRACEELRPEVAVVDLGLPVMDGYELAAALREKLGEAALVLVAVTGYGQERDPERSRRYGFSSHLVKPVEPTVLLSLLAAIARER
jgi:CheY-like chemotaxis protein